VDVLLDRCGTKKREHARLRRLIGRAGLVRPQRRHARDHHRMTAALAELRKGCLQERERAVQVRLDHVPPVLRGELGEPTTGNVRPRGADEHVNRPL
jgi:hypothetical protein